MIVLDTHVWVWMNLAPKELKKSVIPLLEQSKTLMISVLTLWEVRVMLEKGRIQSPLPIEETIARWKSVVPVTVLPVNERIVTLGRTLAFGHEDPLDRLIAATAFNEGVELVTRDSKLLALSWLKTIEA
jgi:PIN domain nuclease of toxin-antitoxin system